jgi:hypothetical protein
MTCGDTMKLDALRRLASGLNILAEDFASAVDAVISEGPA